MLVAVVVLVLVQRHHVVAVMRSRPLAAVTRHYTGPRNRFQLLHPRLSAILLGFTLTPTPSAHYALLPSAMSTAFSTFDKLNHNNSSTNGVSGDQTFPATPLTPPPPASPTHPTTTTPSTPTTPSTSNTPLTSNTSGGSSSTFLHDLASRLQGKRGELAGRALSAPAHHPLSTASARSHSPSTGLDLSKLQQPSLSPPQPLVVLLACGSYSPVTAMHLLLFETARNYLMYETGVLDVVGGIISPVHDSYGKPSLVPAQHRINMTRAATASSSWITTSAWEALQPGWTTTCATMSAYSRYIADAQLYPAPPRLVLLCGADLLESTQVPGLWAAEDLDAILGQYGVAVIERVGLDLERLIEGDERLRRWRSHIWIVPQRVVNNVSSTVVRNMVRDGLSIEYLVDAVVRDYIYQHALFGHDKERERRRRQKPVVAKSAAVDSAKLLEQEESSVDGEGQGGMELGVKQANGTGGVAVLPSVPEAAQHNNQT